MSCLKHGHGSGGLDIPGLRYNYLYIFVETCCGEVYSMLLSLPVEWISLDMLCR